MTDTPATPPTGDEPTGEQPTEQPAAERPAEHPTADRPADRPTAEQPSEGPTGSTAWQPPAGAPRPPAPTYRPASAGPPDPWAPMPAVAASATGPTAERPRRNRSRFAAGVVAASLLVGGGAGIGGAAAWTSFHDSGDSSGIGAPTRSQVVDTPATAAADGSVEQVAAKVLPSVVKIEVSGQQGAGSGSGIILSSDGQILTNNHVVELAGDSGAIRVSFNDGSSAKATVLGTDPLTDTAVIKAEGVSGLTPATIGRSSDLKVGQSVVAIGSPFGLESTVTSGIVSALNRPVDVGSDGQGNSTTYPAVQTDAAINPGNSGGALSDLNGNVVGINSSIRTASSSSAQESGSIGLGFAIPMDEVIPIVDQMVKGQTPTHARLGVSVSNVTGQRGNASDLTEGAQVQEVSKGSTAEDGGIASGDVITKVDDTIITDSDSLVATIRSYRPGDKVTVTYDHDGKEQTTQLQLDSDADTSNS